MVQTRFLGRYNKTDLIYFASDQITKSASALNGCGAIEHNSCKTLQRPGYVSQNQQVSVSQKAEQRKRTEDLLGEYMQKSKFLTGEKEGLWKKAVDESQEIFLTVGTQLTRARGFEPARKRFGAFDALWIGVVAPVEGARD